MIVLPQPDKNRFDGAVRYLRLQTILPSPYTMHEFLELYILRRGSLEITVDGVTSLLQAGDMVILAPFTFHSSADSRDAELEILMAAPHTCPQIDRLFQGKKLADPILRADSVPPLVLAMMDRFSTLFPTLPGKTLDERPIRQSHLLRTEDCGIIRHYLSVLLLELEQNISLIPTDGQGASAMQRVLQYCTTNFQQELTRESVSKACKVSPGFISLIFQRLGVSFRDYVNTLRISHAYELLVNSKKPITEIIYESGFSNQGTFNRNFQDRFGRSPRDIRHGK